MEINGNGSQFKTMVDALPEAVFITDTRGNLVYFNSSAVDLFGYVPETGSKWDKTWKLFDADGKSIPHAKSPIAQVLEKGKNIKGDEMEAERANGERIWIEMHASPTFDAKGHLHGSINLMRDITEQKKHDLLHEVQKNLLEQIAKGTSARQCLSALCEQIPKLSASVRAVFLLTNSTGTHIEQVIAPDFSAAFARNLEGTPATESILGTCGKAITDGIPVECPDITNDTIRTKKWRERCLANGIYACRSHPVSNEKGDVLGSFMLCMRTARAASKFERKLSEIAIHIAGIAIEREKSRSTLRESNARFREMMEQSPLSMQIFDADGFSIMVNPAWERLWGMSKEELGTYNVLEDEQLSEIGIRDEVKKGFKGEVVKLPAIVYSPKKTGENDRRRCVEGYIYPISETENGRYEVALVHHDITERIEAEEALRESEARLEAELNDITLLQKLSTQLIEEENIDELYDKIIDAAITLMHADFASLQMLHPHKGENGALYLLSYKGFSPEAAAFWEWVDLNSSSTCGIALKTGNRVIVDNVEHSELLQGTEDQKVYLETGIKAVQTSPLYSRNGNILGMISTHWKQQHYPNQHHLRLLDMLTRQAADLMERKLAEQELAKSESMYKTLFESIEEGYCIIEMIYDQKGEAVDYRFLQANPACQRILEQDNIVGKTIKELYPDTESIWVDTYAKVAETGEPVSFEERTAFVNKWLQLYAFRFGNPANHQVAVLFNDITARKSSEHSNALLGAIVDNTDDAIISKNLNGIITSWNPSATRLFGYTEAEAIGKHVTILFPDGREIEEDEFMDKIQKGIPVDHFKTVRQRKDGSLINISLTISPIRNAKGKIIGASKIARDITHSIQAQEERDQLLKDVEREQRLLSDVFQNAPSFMCIMEGPQHTIQKANKFFTDIIGNRDIIGKPIKKALPELTKQHFVRILDKVYKTGESFSARDMVVNLITHPGLEPNELYVDFVCQPIRNSEGEITGIFVQGVDLTERNQAKVELQAINETLEERVLERTATLISYQDQLRALAAQLSKAEELERQRLASDLHDNLGQLLAVSKMKIDLLLKEEIEGEIAADIYDIADLMDESIRYTRQLMTDLKPPPSLDRENLVASIKWIADKMQKHNLDVTIKNDGKPTPLNEEVLTTLRQCVQELLFNVVKHAEVDEATITLARVKDKVQITVEDMGIGFDSDGITHNADSESGFGLFNITERMNLMGGSLNIISQPGAGTTVILQAPLLEKEKVTYSDNMGNNVEEEDSGDLSSTPHSGRRIKVLLVDDHPMMREGLRKMIEEEEDLVFIAEATNGEDAIDLTLQLNPDVVVMDVNMPGMNGIEATREISILSPKTRIIGLSLHDNIEVAQAMRNAGAAAYLTKAEVFETLCATIRGEAQAIK